MKTLLDREENLLQWFKSISWNAQSNYILGEGKGAASTEYDTRSRG